MRDDVVIDAPTGHLHRLCDGQAAPPVIPRKLILKDTE
jgi:hypothetical protein